MLQSGESMTEPFFHRQFPSTTAAVAKALTEAMEALEDCSWCNPDNTFPIRLCLEEALVNAVVHGNQNEPSRCVTLRIFNEGDSCRICVHDEGAGFDPESIEMADCTQLGGRGVCLIKEYMEDVSFNGVTRCLEMVFDRDTFSRGCA